MTGYLTSLAAWCIGEVGRALLVKGSLEIFCVDTLSFQCMGELCILNTCEVLYFVSMSIKVVKNAVIMVNFQKTLTIFIFNFKHTSFTSNWHVLPLCDF